MNVKFSFILLALAPFLMGLQIVEGNVAAPLQPGDERGAQDGLPQSSDPLWTSLTRCKVGYSDKTALYTITVTPEVHALQDRTVTASGFILPLDSSDKTKHFLLSKRTPVCLYCPPGEPNEVIEVTSQKPIDWTEDLVTVRGRFKLVNNGEQGIFFAVDDAQTVH